MKEMKKGLVLLSAVVLTAALTSCVNINVEVLTVGETSEEKAMSKEETLGMVEPVDRIVSNMFNANSYREVASASDTEVESYT